jgi:LDH2 family malate/lactate/ureidoglycolate dehydrogenase
VKHDPRYRLDDLQRFATTLLAGLGVSPTRAMAMASQLLWFDAAGAPEFGIQTLPDWLDRIGSGEIDPAAEGRVGVERTGTAVLDGQKGLPPLILARAAELAVEKARDAGVGLVRVTNVSPAGPAAAVVAEVAIGPLAAAAIGPRGSWALALPSVGGLPAVFDSALGVAGADSSAPTLWDVLAPWGAVLAPEGTWLLAAFSVAAVEPLTTFQERFAVTFSQAPPLPRAVLLPGPWETLRRDAHERGISLKAAAWSRFQQWAERLGVGTPQPWHVES